MSELPFFEEKQYLGRDKSWISVRLILALFCFVAYYFTAKEDKNSQQLFFLVGCIIIIISVVMLYLVQFKTEITKEEIIISGLWSSTTVNIPIGEIHKVKRKPYSRFFFNNPVYNLHKNGNIRFFASGNDAIWLQLKNGKKYIIGTQRPIEFEKALKEQKGS
ncbi:MAG TPA: hypothetical protein VK076_03990 [Candidatus Sphingobacterium stercoripullorum]|uniref:PH domain-containing protein n=1 Tax=Candidatus Sphingobacterium stercoripullorum TaxID=2838759 RepID=A0A9D1W7Y9_9SPHI|nr:hypothetical protein [Candidatus Sphingobacterium stercoripullorum]HLR49713.1 hypothetical protein [Candidatus Sphingobacterium stercoripullorum]